MSQLTKRVYRRIVEVVSLTESIKDFHKSELKLECGHIVESNVPSMDFVLPATKRNCKWCLHNIRVMETYVRNDDVIVKF